MYSQVVRLSKGIDTKAKYDGQRGREIFIEGSINNMVNSNDSAKVHNCLLVKKVVLIKNEKNNGDLDLISLFLLNVLLFRLKCKTYCWG